jgi:hypothetical protein
MHTDMVGRNPTMNFIELSPDDNWRWIAASIVDGTEDPERNHTYPQWPLIDVNAVCPSFTGEYPPLIINQGGLQNRETPIAGKKLFKESVLPYLMQIVGTSSPLTGKLVLRLERGKVSTARLY